MAADENANAPDASIPTTWVSPPGGPDSQTQSAQPAQPALLAQPPQPQPQPQPQPPQSSQPQPPLVTDDGSPLFPDPIPGLIPFGSLTIFAGATGSGKTTMLVPWIDAWLHGGTICGYPTTKPTELVWITADRQWDETKTWFERKGLDTTAFTTYAVLDDPLFPMAKLKVSGTVGEAFQYCIDKTNPPPGALVIFDPLTPLFIQGDTNKARDVALSLLTYTRLCLNKRISLLCTGHFGKQKGGRDDRYARPQDRIAGSNAFGGYSSTQIYLLDPEGIASGETPVWTLGWVPRHGPACQFSYMRDSEGFFVEIPDSGTVTQPTDDSDHAHKTRMAMLALLPAAPETVSFTVIADQMARFHGTTRSTAFRYRRALEDAGWVRTVGRGQVVVTTAGEKALASWPLVEGVQGASRPS